MTMPFMSMDASEIDAKLSFADLRLRELLALNAGDVAGPDGDDRDRQTAEFFSHVVSTTEVLAQYVNEVKDLRIAPPAVSVRRVSETLGITTPAGDAVGKLYVHIGSTPYPIHDPYTDAALVYRMLLYRNHVTHHRRAPFQFQDDREVHLHLDPTDPAKGASKHDIQVELPRILDLVRRRCADVLAHL